MAVERKKVTLDYEYGIIDRETGKVSTFLDWQAVYYEEQLKHRINASGPGLGGGKTSLNLYIAGEEGLFKFPGLWCLFVHQDNLAAYKTLVMPFFKIFPRYYKDPRTGKMRSIIKPNDELSQQMRQVQLGFSDDPATWMTIRWGGLDESKDQPEKLFSSGDEYGLIVMTQAERVKESAFVACRDRLRQPLLGHKNRMLIDFNKNRTWPTRIFVKGELDKDADPADYYFRWVKTTDNILHLDPDYVKDLLSQPKSVRDVKMGEKLEMDSDAAFEVFDDTLLNLTDPLNKGNVVRFEDIPIQATWQLSEDMDWGSWPHPCAGLWRLTDHEGNIFALDEWEFYKQLARQASQKVLDYREKLLIEIAAKVKNLDANGNPNHKDQAKMYRGTFGPPDMGEHNPESGKSVADLWWSDPSEKNLPAEKQWRGIRIKLINPDVNGRLGQEQAKLTALRQMLAYDPEHIHPITRRKGSPHYFITTRCKRLIHQLNSAMTDDRGFVDMTAEKNPYVDQEGIDTAIEHKDVLSAAMLGVQEFRSPRSPQEHKTINPEWQRIEKLMAGKSQNPYARK